jgi:hypothetical protein
VALYASTHRYARHLPPTARKPRPHFEGHGATPLPRIVICVNRKTETFAVEYCWLRPDELFLVTGFDYSSLMVFLAKTCDPTTDTTGPFKNLVGAVCSTAAEELRARWSAARGRPYPVDQLVFKTIRDLPPVPPDCPQIFIVEDLSNEDDFDSFKKASNRDRPEVSLFSSSSPGFALKVLRRQLLKVTRL